MVSVSESGLHIHCYVVPDFLARFAHVVIMFARAVFLVRYCSVFLNQDYMGKIVRNNATVCFSCYSQKMVKKMFYK